jgi:hypothetical protein
VATPICWRSANRPDAVGKMAGHIVLPWIHRVFALMKRWGLGTYRHVSSETMLGLASHPLNETGFIGDEQRPSTTYCSR